MIKSKFKNAIVGKDSHINTLRFILAVFVAFTFVLLMMYIDARKTQTFHVPPDLRQGIIKTKDSIPDPSVFQFGHYIFQQLNNWPQNGIEDYPNKIYQLQAFLTPNYRDILETNLKAKTENGELRDRIRTIQLTSDGYYQATKVKDLGTGNAWAVTLVYELIEHVHSLKVKNIKIEYEIKVVRYDVDPEKNPWGLALDGYLSEPKLINSK